MVNNERRPGQPLLKQADFVWALTAVPNFRRQPALAEAVAVAGLGGACTTGVFAGGVTVTVFGVKMDASF